jgi:hypothetical protein
MNSWLLNLFCLEGSQINAEADESGIPTPQAENLQASLDQIHQDPALHPSFVPEKWA